MSTYFPDDSFDELVPSSDKRFIGKTDASLPPFNKLQTVAIISKKIKKSPQAIAIQIALNTRRDGTFRWKLRQIAELVGYEDEDAVSENIEKIVEAGLLVRIRTNTGYVYRWTLAAYKGVDVGPDRDIDCSYDIGFHHVVIATYLVTWRAKYTPGVAAPSVVIEGDKSDINKDRLAFMKPYAYDLATRIRLADETMEAAIEKALLLFWEKWISRAGLAKYQHPLPMLSERDIKEDFASIYSQNTVRTKATETNSAKSVDASNAEVDNQAHLQHASEALAFASGFNGPTGAIPRRAA